MPAPGDEEGLWADLYSVTKGQQAIRELADVMRERTGNLPPLLGICPDYSAPKLRKSVDDAIDSLAEVERMSLVLLTTSANEKRRACSGSRFRP
jgi:hypothetical protein